MSQDKPMDQERPHVADGIKEYDNPMPPWWVALFYFCIAWSIFYMAYYHLGTGASLIEKYNTTSEHAQLLQKQQQGEPSDQNFAAVFNDPASIKEGSELYMINCMPCHGDQGQGSIGPNLTDEYWLHGGAPQDVLKSVREGISEKGMIAWGPVIGEEKVQKVTAFVLSLQGTNPSQAKAPEGEAYQGD